MSRVPGLRRCLTTGPHRCFGLGIRRYVAPSPRRRLAPGLRRCLIPLAVLALAAIPSRPLVPSATVHAAVISQAAFYGTAHAQRAPASAAGAAITPQRSQSVLAARRTRHTILRGYLTDRHPWSDSTLDVYSKAHHTTYHAEMTRSTVVREHGQTIARAALRSGQYVFVTCDKGSGNTYVAIRVTIVVRHSRKRH